VSVFDKNTRRVLSYDVLRQKIAVFTYRSPHFVSPADAPATITQSHGHSVTVSLRDSRRGDKFLENWHQPLQHWSHGSVTSVVRAMDASSQWEKANLVRLSPHPHPLTDSHEILHT